MSAEPRLKHVGADAIFAERTKILNSYDAAKQQLADDPVKVEHGNVAEDIFRKYLASFLPRKYGVAKGHIITRSLTYEGPLEEWDILIYDALEAPVLYVRDGSGGTPRLGIPVQHVYGVVEVKATLNQANSRKVTNKLLKLRSFQSAHTSVGVHRPTDFLPFEFTSMAVFFETATKNAADYVKCLNELRPLSGALQLPFEHALILRSQNHPNSSAIIGAMQTGSESPLLLVEDERFEMSDPAKVDLPDCDIPMYAFMISYGFGINMFSDAMMNLVERLNDGPGRDTVGGKTDLSGFGFDRGEIERQPLWPKVAPK